MARATGCGRTASKGANFKLERKAGSCVPVLGQAFPHLTKNARTLTMENSPDSVACVVSEIEARRALTTSLDCILSFRGLGSQVGEVIE
jgi:hypothetical protein